MTGSAALLKPERLTSCTSPGECRETVYIEQGGEGAAGHVEEPVVSATANTDVGADSLFAFLCALSCLSWLRGTAECSSYFYYFLFFPAKGQLFS